MIKGSMNGNVKYLRLFVDLAKQKYGGSFTAQLPECMSVPRYSGDATLTFTVNSNWIDFNFLRQREFQFCYFRLEMNNRVFEKSSGSFSVEMILNKETVKSATRAVVSFSPDMLEDDEDVLDDFSTMELYEERYRRGRA